MNGNLIKQHGLTIIVYNNNKNEKTQSEKKESKPENKKKQSAKKWLFFREWGVNKKRGRRLATTTQTKPGAYESVLKVGVGNV